MSWTRLRQLFGGAKRTDAQAIAIPVGAASMDIITRPLAMAGTATREIERNTLDAAAASAEQFVNHRYGGCVLDQAAAFPLTADGQLADTVESAWHFGFWTEKNGPDWPRSYVSLRTEPNGGPDAREHDGFQADPVGLKPLEMNRCIKPAQAIKAALRAGLTHTDDATFHVVYFAASEGQPALARVSSHRAGNEMDHRCVCPYSGRTLPPPLKAKKGRPVLTRS